jgi:TPR repeat protein
MYESGEGFKRRDFDTAERMYIAGCGYGNNDACQAARLLPRANETAKKTAKNACAAGNRDACQALK